MRFLVLKYSIILDVFEHKHMGLFALLNDNCKISTESINFVRILCKSWTNGSIVINPTSKDMVGRKIDSCFIIRHFANDVLYDAVRRMFFYI